MKFAAIGRTAMLYNAIVTLSKNGHNITAIITTKSSPEYTKRESDFRLLAKKVHAPFFLTGRLNSPEIVKAIKGSALAVSVNWTSIFTQEQIDCFKIGILNAHMGDLPKYRGNACPNWAILNGEKEVVISIHLVESGTLDCGRVIIQDRLPISRATYISDVYVWAENAIPNLFVKALSALQRDPAYTLKYADMNSRESFRCYPRRPEDSKIEWMSSAEKIHRLIRASSRPFNGAYGFVNKKRITIWKAELCDDNEHYAAIPGQICEVGPHYFIVIAGEGKLKITEWECAVKIKTIRQRLR